jgi:hypothetical protein
MFIGAAIAIHHELCLGLWNQPTKHALHINQPSKSLLKSNNKKSFPCIIVVNSLIGACRSAVDE